MTRLRSVFLLPPLAMLLAACASSSRPVAVSPQPGEALLQQCVDPRLVPDPESASDGDLQLEKLELARAYVDCRSRLQKLVAGVRETSVPSR
jgi:hypothetical protein